VFEALKDFFHQIEEAKRRDAEELHFDGSGFMRRIYGLENTPDYMFDEEERRHDPLTGFYTPTAFKELMVQEIAAARRYEIPLSILAIEAQNPAHPPEDSMEYREGMHAIARHFKDTFRSADLLFRWGRELFVVVMPHTDVQGAEIAARKLQESLCQYDVCPICHWHAISYQGEEDVAELTRRLLKKVLAHVETHARQEI